MGFTYFDQNISRRNPRYDDPVFDANQTQPQLVAAGEERFTGGALKGKYKGSNAWTISGKATFNHAITTKSAGLPEEIGRARTRFPRFTGGLNTRYSFGPERKSSDFSLSAGLTYLSDVVASYENVTPAYSSYPSSALVNVSLSYRFKAGIYNHGVTLSIRNALDRDLLAQVARAGAGREFAINDGLNS